MQLDDAQKQQVAAWLAEGLKLAEIQDRLGSEFDVHLTYLEVKLLVSELEVLPKDPDPQPETPVTSPGPAAQPGAAPGAPPATSPTAPASSQQPESPASGGGVSVTLDQLAKPGALVSGRVTFSDGQSGSWYVDEMGRLGLAPNQ